MQNKYLELRGILKSWLWVILCSFGIFVTIPVAGPISKYIENLIGREISGYIALFVVAVALAILFHTLIFRLQIKRISQYLWLFTTAAAYIYISFQLLSNPSEVFHLLAYAFLSYLLFRALSHVIKDSTIYFTSALFGMFIGTIDECIQWMMPDRVFDFRDIGLNFLVGALFQLAIWKGIQPKIISKPIEKFSINMLAGIITVNLFFLLLCFSNTPKVVYRYTSIIKPLSWLNSVEPMNEFGYRHNDPEIGVFYSRFSFEELKYMDFLNRESNGNILSEDISSDANYSQFLKIYNPSTNPFLHELRVRLFRRDKHMKISLESVNTIKKKAASYIAIKENLIAEKYFGNTLRQSKFLWSEQLIEQLTEMAASWDKAYRSSVSSGVITSFSLKTVWKTIIFSLIIIWIFVELWKRRMKT
jgi:hypothetical protein